MENKQEFEEYQKQNNKVKEAVRKQRLRGIYMSVLMTMVSNTPELMRVDAQAFTAKAWDIASWADLTWTTNAPDSDDDVSMIPIQLGG